MGHKYLEAPKGACVEYCTSCRANRTFNHFGHGWELCCVVCGWNRVKELERIEAMRKDIAAMALELADNVFRSSRLVPAEHDRISKAYAKLCEACKDLKIS